MLDSALPSNFPSPLDILLRLSLPSTQITPLLKSCLKSGRNGRKKSVHFAHPDLTLTEVREYDATDFFYEEEHDWLSQTDAPCSHHTPPCIVWIKSQEKRLQAFQCRVDLELMEEWRKVSMQGCNPHVPAVKKWVEVPEGYTWVEARDGWVVAQRMMERRDGVYRDADLIWWTRTVVAAGKFVRARYWRRMARNGGWKIITNGDDDEWKDGRMVCLTECQLQV
jgi:hypothetical protein